MSDILYNAAIAYQKLENVIYRIVIGRKRISYVLNIYFPAEAFFHLSGLQHLTDITFPSRNKERIYKEILNKRIGINLLQKSVFYDEYFIQERLSNFCHIEEMLDSNAVTYLINKNNYARYTNIRADYLCERKFLEEILYLFIVRELKESKDEKCRCCSFFKKHGNKSDYTTGTSKTTTLLIEKIADGKVNVLFRNPAYKDI